MSDNYYEKAEQISDVQDSILKAKMALRELDCFFNNILPDRNYVSNGISQEQLTHIQEFLTEITQAVNDGVGRTKLQHHNFTVQNAPPSSGEKLKYASNVIRLPAVGSTPVVKST